MRLRLKKYKRMLGICLVLLLFFSVASVSISSAALTEGKSGKSTWVYMGAGKDGKKYKSTNTSNSQPKYTVKVGSTKYVGYCINKGKGWGTGTAMTSRSFAKSKAVNEYSASKREMLSYVLLFGYNSGLSAPYGNTNDYYAATQTLVWQVLEGDIVLNLKNGLWTRNCTSGKPYSLIKGHKYGIQCYNHIKKQMSAHVKGLSFGQNTLEDAKKSQTVMKYNYKTKKWTATLIDKNGAFKYKKTSATSGLAVSRSGSKYTFTKSASGAANMTMMSERSLPSQSAMVFDSGSSKVQSVALGATDTKKQYVAFVTEPAGKGRIIKVDKEGNALAGFTFQVSCKANGYNAKWTTGDDGTITKDLYPGTYIVREVLSDKQIKENWEKAPDEELVVRAGETKGIEIVNVKSKTKKMRIVKTVTDDGPLSGFRFIITGTVANQKTLSEKEIIETAAPKSIEGEEISNWEVTDSKVIDEINSDAAAGKTGEYQVTINGKLMRAEAVSETDTDMDEDVSEDDNEDSNTELPDNKDPAATNEPVESSASDETSIKVNITTLPVGGESETEKKAAGGIEYYDFSWAGVAATYNETMTTDEDGQITIDSIEAGTYTVKEDMDANQLSRYHKPVSQTVTIGEEDDKSLEPFVFENKAKEREVKVIKKCVDGNIANITFRITGTTAWGESIKPIDVVTDEAGIADFGTLPAGKYTAEEVDVDFEIYMPIKPVEFEITGEEEDGSVLELNFENKPISTVEISKQDGTTGEELPGARLTLIDTKSGETIEQWISEDEPHMISGLEYGQELILREELPPDGFATANEVNITAGIDQKVVMVDELTQVTISKQDVANGEELKGARLRVENPETGETVEEWTSGKEPHMIEGLVEGKEYVLVEDQAPLGFEIAESINFVVGEDNEVVMKDEHSQGIIPDIVEGIMTGDRDMLLPILILGALATLAALYFGYRKLRRDEW